MNKPISFNLELTPDIANGVYSNFQGISYSPTEFVLDFARIVPNTTQGKVLARVIMHPANAKAMADHISRAIKAFEEKHGVIKTGPQSAEGGPIGFKAVPPESPE